MWQKTFICKEKDAKWYRSSFMKRDQYFRRLVGGIIMQASS